MIPHSAGRSAGLTLRLMGERMLLGLVFFFLLAGGLVGSGVDGPRCFLEGDPSSSDSDTSLFGAMVQRLGAGLVLVVAVAVVLVLVLVVI